MQGKSYHVGDKKAPHLCRVVQGFLKMFSGSDLTATKTPRDRGDLLAFCVMGFSISVFPKQPLVAFAVHEHDQGNGNQNGWKSESPAFFDSFVSQFHAALPDKFFDSLPALLDGLSTGL